MLSFCITVKTWLTKALEWFVILVVGLLVLDVLWGVCTRFLLGSPSRWTEELATILLVWLSLLGAAVAFGRKEHLGVDYLAKKLDGHARRWLAMAVQLIVAAFAALIMVYGGVQQVAATLKVGQMSPALELPWGYVYLAVPISGLFIVLFAFEQLLELAVAAPYDLSADEEEA
jgi:TRAP-type C4-dicarboxylate transport system permease small subunit